MQAKALKEPALAWWINHTIKKGKQIAAKVKSKHWTRAHEFGIKIPKSIREARRLDEENGNTLWWDAMLK